MRRLRWVCVHCTPASSHSLHGPAALALQVCVEGGGVFAYILGGGGLDGRGGWWCLNCGKGQLMGQSN